MYHISSELEKSITESKKMIVRVNIYIYTFVDGVMNFAVISSRSKMKY
jgi:hypothetical protein